MSAALHSSAVFLTSSGVLSACAYGRARAMGDAFDVRLVSVCCGAVALAVAALPGIAPDATIVGLAGLAVSAATDCASGYVYDVVAAIAAGALAVAAIASGSAIGVAQGACLATAFGLAVRLITRTRGLALGDVKLFALAGAVAGARAVPLLVAAAYVGGTVVYLPLVMLGRLSRAATVPFAPFIAFATTLAVMVQA